MVGKRLLRCVAAAVVLGVVGMPLFAVFKPQVAVAWNGTTSASYYDGHWNDCRNPDSYPPVVANMSLPWPYGMPPYTSDGYLCFGNPPGYDNCQAAVSEALNAGGYSYINQPAYNDTWYWNLGNEGARGIRNPTFSREFADSQWFYGFIVLYDHDNHNGTGAGGGLVWRVDSGASPSNPTSTLYKGDVLLFALNGGWISNINHSRMETGWYSTGQTPPHSGYYQPWNSYVYWGDYADNQSPGRLHDFWNGAYAGGSPQNYIIWEIHVDPANA